MRLRVCSHRGSPLFGKRPSLLAFAEPRVVEALKFEVEYHEHGGSGAAWASLMYIEDQLRAFQSGFRTLKRLPLASGCDLLLAIENDTG